MPENTDAVILDGVPAVAPDGAPVPVDKRDKPRSLWNDAWYDLSRKPIFYISALVILFLIVISIWPGLIASQDPLQCNLIDSQNGPSSGHWFGFDQQGCDVYTRTVYGARASVEVGIFSTLGVAVLGAVLGGLSGYFGGWLDSIISRVSDIFFGIPILLGGVVFLSAVKGGSVLTVSTFIILLGWPQLARIARGAVITAKEQDYVLAAKALGAGHGRILLRHIAPNALAPVIVWSTIALGTFISLEATLSFLGVGLKPPAVSWGIDISAAAEQIRNAPHMLLWPAGALSVTVLAFILLGDAVRDALDPKLR
ncbi:ABC transporter permease [Streptomyces cocklensis]|uniref:Oligopeptide transport system permease protein n=1 Tax=Actinacidiphila cocklensis TaxID=887465 RepID=A0A9W4DR07_9ACTN|nr:ABC transporter permease [Actinacidiphila cocklensis]MDD1062790.1 ABC transporter permease [Actinacidiphila cocklensis]WSX77025.1 ABC transporter permease [Streptomyces sp. NBC_00899]CAG6396071.1 Oligopeptide transport system permease protein [Actinacidiphila cocklensis]